MVECRGEVAMQRSVGTLTGTAAETVTCICDTVQSSWGQQCLMIRLLLILLVKGNTETARGTT